MVGLVTNKNVLIVLHPVFALIHCAKACLDQQIVSCLHLGIYCVSINGYMSISTVTIKMVVVHQAFNFVMTEVLTKGTGGEHV